MKYTDSLQPIWFDGTMIVAVNAATERRQVITAYIDGLNAYEAGSY